MTSPYSRSGRMLKDTTIPLTPVQQESAEETLRALQDAVGRGVAVETLLWTFNTNDWVTNVQAADIDHDGDIEVLISTRDGFVRALTRWGSVKWERQLIGHSIKTMGVIHSLSTTAEDQASIIVGTRSGHVLALNKSGDPLPDWEYASGRLVRQIYTCPLAPDLVVIACEDRCIHFLDSKTGRPCRDKFCTGDWVRSVYVSDIDGDGRAEILAGSGDTYLYVLDDHGNFLDRLALGYQCYTLFAAPLEPGGPVHILTSSTEKELSAWTVSRHGAQWTFEKAWERTEDAHIFENRVYSIYVKDINRDGQLEILLGSEDGHLYLLDQHGEPLWKRASGSSVNSVFAVDINSDDQVEILIGTEDNGASVIHVELSRDLYKLVREAYQLANTFYAQDDILKTLSFRERLLLEDFIADRSRQRPERKQLETALALMKDEAYEKALSLFLQLMQQRVQFYWSSPIETRGYIWAQCFANVAADSILEIIVGTDQGWVYAFDTENDGQHLLWEKDLGARVLILLSIKFSSNPFDSIIALLASRRLVVLNHKGEIVQERAFEGAQEWATDISIYRSRGQDDNTVNIVIGQENNCISIWDLSLQAPITTIHTAQGISTTYIYDINNDGVDEIISGSLGNHVYAHSIQGLELWRFEIMSDVKSLCVQDIDRDGYPEIIVGSEDCYVYVLNHEGKLKWSYRAERSILNVNVCDIKLENDRDDDDNRAWKILMGGADKILYVLSAEGDLLWKYRNLYPIHLVRTRDVNHDGRYEIALASEKQLELLQILNANELTEYANQCWKKILEAGDYRTSIMQLTYHEDEFIRAYALAKLAGQHKRLDADFKRFQDALHSEKSSQVKRELVRSIAVLCRVPYVHEGNILQARLLLQQLYTDPDEEIKLTIVDILPDLIEIDERLCFEYFERFTDNIDIWIRRKVVRHLDKLVEQHTEATFALLKKTAKDEDAWVRRETGRVLAHYFDAHPDILGRDVLALLYTGTDPDLLRQISFSAATPTNKQLFHVLARLLTQDKEENIEHLLNEAITTIEEDPTRNSLGQRNPLLSLFEEFRRLFGAKTISDIARYRRVIYDISMPGMQSATVVRMNHIFESLQQVMLVVKTYQRREALGDRVTGLLDALNALERLRDEIPREELRQKQKTSGVFILLENIILTSLLDQWSTIIKRELYNLRGEAHLVASIRNTVVQPEAEIVISLGITNTGRSPAERVQVELEESHDFTIIGSRCLSVQEISSSAPTAVNFSIAPHHANPRLSFRLTFDDAERKGRQEHFADIVTIQEHARPYRFIPNPYTSGTPIRDESMFYGRTEDREILCEKLSSVSANKVVVLSGQRRVGKTSLLNQLAKDLSAGPYAPVFIDLQAISPVTNVPQLLQYFASCISSQVLLDKALTLPDHATFLGDPMATFDAYLEYVLHELAGCRLVFLLDEFERLQDLVNKGVLDYGVLHYLRSIMQHRQNISYLISGAPRYMRTLTETSWSVFFNIALFHHLTRLKDHEAEALITKPVGKYLEYDSLALERVRTLTGDQPYLIHIFSEKLIAHCNKRKKSYLTINDVNSVLDVLLEEQTSSIQWIWSQDSATERFLLAILAQEKGQAGRVFTLSDIEEEYSNCNIPYGEKAVTEALQNLVQDDIVEERFHGTQFRISVGFMKEWVARTRPPERVAREERLIC